MIELDKSLKQIQSAAREFAKGEFDKDTILDMEKAGLFPRDTWREAADLGFIGLHLDEEFGGGGLGLLESLITLEALCRRDSSCGLALGLAASGAELIQILGNEAQKKAVLEPVCEGRALCGAALFEPGQGYDPTSCETQARLEGDEWVITGKKIQVANGAVDGDIPIFFPLLCRTENGLSLILVDHQTPGLALTPTPRKLGNNLCPTADMFLDQARVPAANLLGKEGKALKAVNGYLDQVKYLNAGMALGIAQGSLDRALAYGKQREQFGRPVLVFEGLSRYVGEMALNIKGSRSLVYDAALVADTQRKPEPGLADMAMESACRTAESAADASLQIHGGFGYMQEGEIEHFYRDAKYLKLLGSHPHSRLSTLAKLTVGKIKTPKRA